MVEHVCFADGQFRDVRNGNGSSISAYCSLDGSTHQDGVHQDTFEALYRTTALVKAGERTKYSPLVVSVVVRMRGSVSSFTCLGKF